ncbi:PREDICTED: AT-rich interactive domain-containing protein 4A-like isoform X2 [Polistes dominula]|uniref:AT-rich interactive domain-containing protein 4A-like isoform X2 n=1 Tax=Polistes dominula TaxID=743375 RepID=A0ABM1IZW2_POLDO|nr:PREDICTED: AT-rich interactive domain-containing protein 4A-like isoform X2 [Polistes dominula]
MLGDDPPYLSVGTEVSAKYKGAFCEAKIRKVVRSVKCRVTYKQGLGTATVTDDQIRGTLRVGASVEARHSDKKDFVEATITKIQDCSQYTVVFDDGDITTLRRTALCLKSGRHFAESETLDQLPLTHPEHFGNPVIGGRRGRRSRDESSDDEDSPPRGNRDFASNMGGKEGIETEPEIGRVVCVELGDKKKKDNWFPGLVVAPTAQDTVRIRVRDDYLVRSFKDARYYTVPKKEATEFTKELVNKVENSTLKVAVEKALLFLEKNELPPHWDRDSLFGNSVSSGNSDSDRELDSDSSDDEPREEKDHFVAQLYKFMDDRGTPINNCPMIGSEDIDLYRLFRAVYKLGGYNRVTNQNQWKSITRRLSFSMQNSPSTHNLVKQAYKKFLHSFEDFYRKLGCTMVNHPRGSTRKQRPGRSLIRDKDRNTPIPPPAAPVSKNEKEEDEKKSQEDEKKDKKETKKEQLKEDESKLKKKDDVDEVGSGQESDINVDADPETSSSEKSPKISPQIASVPSRAKLKSKEDNMKKKVVEKKKSETKKQEKKDEKVKEEEATKTRSKSKDDTVKNKASSEARETRTPSRESERRALTKQRRLTDEELKRRGRKRKEYEAEKSKTDEQPGESAAPCYKGPVELGDRLKVYYGPTHESKVTYEAKIIDMEKDGNEPMYLVHYTGWNTRYDEWIKPSRIAQNFTQAQGRIKRNKATSRPQTPSTNSSGNVNKSSKSNGNAASNAVSNAASNVASTNAASTNAVSTNASQNRRRAQSVVPVTNTTSTSSKEIKKEEKDKDKETTQPIRSTTPLSVTSSSSRTKSPATPANNRQTRTNKNMDFPGIEPRRRTRRTSGHTDISIPSETDEDSEAYESDTTEPDQTKTRSKGTDERKRRDVRNRDDRIKAEDISEGEDDKDNIEEPRRGRRLRRTLAKVQGVKSEPDSDEEQPKGRDFDLNQIRSELKGFDKAVKLELVRVEPNSEDGIKTEEKENLSTLISPKIDKNVEVLKTENIPNPKPIDSNEDIYEFKEPEPFEFEVRNKRDTNAEKDKIKKRMFEEEPKSPKKKQKPVTSPITKDTKSDSDNDSRNKKSRKLFSNKRADDSNDTTIIPLNKPLQAATPPQSLTCEEAFDKLCVPPSSFSHSKSSTNLEETGKVVNSIDLLFSDLPGDDDVTHDDSEDRLIISETEVSETEQENLFTYHQEMFTTTSDLTDTIDLEKGTTNTQADPPIREDLTLSVIVNKPGGALEQKQNVKSSPVSRLSPELRTLDAKLINIQPILSPVVVTPAPISTRLPATSTIEEKLSAAAMAFRNKTKDTPKEDEVSDTIRKINKEVTKKIDTSVVLHKNKEDQIISKHEIDNRNREEEDITMKEEEQRRDIMCVVIKQKEEELQQLKLKKESELKKFTEIKIVTEQRKTQDSKDDDDWKNEDNIGCSIIEEDIKEQDSKEREKDKRKKVVNQEIVDSTDSSDSEQRLVIDNEEPQDIKDPISNFDTKLRAELDKFQDSQEHYPKTQTPKPVLNLNPQQQQQQQQQQECITDFKSESISGIINIKTDEEGETINSLLCEEEIPGSPAPPVEIIEKDNAGPSYSPPQAEINETNIVLMEMPFASAPTSGESTTSNTVATLSMALPKPVETSIPSALPIQQNSTLGLRQQVQHQHLPALMPAQRRESNDAAPVMDNTPPTTPDSSISNISGSPREERIDGSSPISEDNMKLNRDSSEADNDSGGKGQGFIEDDILTNSERNSGDRALKAPAKRSVEETQSPKKRKRNRKHSECGGNIPKKTGRPSGRHTRNGAGSDSDDTSEGSNLCLVNPTSTNHTNINSVTDLNTYSSRPPRQVKYNFYVEFGPELDGSQRIAVLQQKLTELRQTYNSVKVELAAIERRKKKLRRRDREATKAAKAEMQQACS